MMTIQPERTDATYTRADNWPVEPTHVDCETCGACIGVWNVEKHRRWHYEEVPVPTRYEGESGF